MLRAEAARAEEQRAAAAEEAQQLLEQNKDVARRALRTEVARMEAQRTAALRQQQLEHAADVEALQREHGREYERLGSVHAAEARLLVERYEGRIAAVQQSCSKSRAVTQAELQAVEERCRRDAAAAQVRALEEAAGREAGLRAQLSCAQSQSEKVVQGVAHAHHRELQQLRRRLEVRRKAAARPHIPPAAHPSATRPSLSPSPSRCPYHAHVAPLQGGADPAMQRAKADNARLARRVAELEQLLSAMQSALQAEGAGSPQAQAPASKEWV